MLRGSGDARTRRGVARAGAVRPAPARANCRSAGSVAEMRKRDCQKRAETFVQDYRVRKPAVTRTADRVEQSQWPVGGGSASKGICSGPGTRGGVVSQGGQRAEHRSVEERAGREGADEHRL